jgi:hypothetical protein
VSANSKTLRKIFDEARPLVEQALDLSDKFKGFRELATANGLDWSQIKALLKAQIQDERADDGKDRVGRIIEKADFAMAYADMLGLGTAKMNENNFSSEHGTAPEVCSAMTTSHEATIARHVSCRDGQGVRTVNSPGDLPPHEDGVIVEPASAPSDAEAGQGEGTWRPSSVAPPTVSTRRNEDEGDAAQPEERGTLTGSTDGGSDEDEVASTITKSSDNRQVLDEPSGAVPGSAVESGAQVSQSVALALPVVTDALGSFPETSAVETPGAPHSGEMPDIPDFLRRVA